MRSLRLFATAAVLSTTIAASSGCSATAKVKVPQSRLDSFIACMDDVHTSFVVPSTPGIMAAPHVMSPLETTIGIALPTLRDAAHGNAPLHDTSPGQFFITDDMVSPADRALPLLSEQSNRPLLSASFHAPLQAMDAVADRAESLWSHRVHQTFLKTFNHLANSNSSATTLRLNLTMSDIREFVDLAGDVAERDAWHAFAHRTMLAYAESSRAVSAAQAADRPRLAASAKLSAQKSMAAIFSGAYLKAYFRNGKFVQGAWKLENPLEHMKDLAKATSGADQRIIQDLLKVLPPNAATDLQKIIDKLAKGTIGKVSEAGFVSRGGDALAVSPLMLTFDATAPQKKLTVSNVDFDTVATEVVRVTLEAVFDSLNYVPAVSNATGVVGLAKDYKAFTLADFGSITKPDGKSPVMSADDFGEVERLGATAHSATASVTASLIRGISITALNNEAVAKMLSSLTGTIARKVTERVGWCYYASLKGKRDASPEHQKTVEINVRY